MLGWQRDEALRVGAHMHHLWTVRHSSYCPVLAVTATAAFAASPHYVQGPRVSVDANSITISGKAAGLGNAAETADASLTGTVEVFSRCYNRGGIKPQADNKRETINVNQGQTFDVRNGQVTFSFTVSPIST